ncbi:MAG: hypothetical protein ABSE69_14645 [Roseiarcus sp.]|jgi:hypothetical protein
MSIPPTKKANPRRRHPQDAEPFDRFGVLLEEAQKFCAGVGLHKDLILEISESDSDWAFILKIDALLETATKTVVRHALRLKILNRVFHNDALGEFVDSLPINDRTSIVKLLDAAGCPTEDIGFIEATRRVRNAYAHQIKLVDVSLIELIKQRPDRSDLLRKLSAIKTFVEADLIATYEKDHGFLRFCILDSTMRVLFFAYQVAVKIVPKK